MPLKATAFGTNVGVGKRERNEHTWPRFLILGENRLFAFLKMY